MIKVLHFIPAFNIGGVESLIMSLYRNIDKSKIQFDFLVETEEEIEDFNEIKKYGGNIHYLQKLNKKNPFKYIKQIKDFFMNNSKNYSILHCHNIERSLFILYYAKKNNINCRIFHAHTDSFRGVKYEKLVKIILNLDIKLSTHFLSPSKNAGNFHFKNKNYQILNNAIDTKEFSFSENKRKIMRLKMDFNKKFVIGHTGRFTYAKNHLKIINIFNEVYKKEPMARLLLVGDGPLKKDIEKRINDLGLSKVVIFTGGRKDISDLLQTMDVFLLPSFFEGFCISLLEAQSVGLPCVISDVIPKEVQITNLIHRHKLNEDNKIWADKILLYKYHKRIGYNTFIKAKGYDIQQNADWLMKFYFKIYNEKKG